LPSVFGARRRLTTSATATTYGHSARSSHNPRRDGHRDALPFLYLPRPLPCGSGDRRRAAQRPPTQTPVPVPPGSHQVFPTAIPASTRHLRELPRGVLVAINVHGSEDQAKDASSAETRESHISVFSRPVHALRRVHADVVPFLSALWTSVVAGAFAERGGDPFSSPDRTKIHIPTLTREGQRHPADRDAFHRCAASGVRPSDCSAERILRVGPSLTPPTRSPQVVERCLHGHCKHQSAVTRDPWHSRNRSPLLPMGSILSNLLRAWD
jgi:hypothetical protein